MTMNKIPTTTGLRARWLVDLAAPTGRRLISIWAPVEPGARANGQPGPRCPGTSRSGD